MQLALTRSLLVLQDASRRELTRDLEKRERVCRYYLAVGKEIPEKIKTNISRKKSTVKMYIPAVEIMILSLSLFLSLSL